MLKGLLRFSFFFILLMNTCRAEDDLVSHHLSDSYCGPIILLTKKGFDVFMLSRFFDNEGRKVDYRGYFLDDKGGILSREDVPFIDLSLTKNVLWMFLGIFILILLFLFCSLWYRRYSFTKAPHGIVNLVEMIITMLIDDVFKKNIGEEYKRFSPFLVTMFFFIWINNMLGLLPGAGNVTGSISVTACLAFLTFLVVNCNGSKHYYKHMFAPSLPMFLYPIIVPLEIIGVFIKPITLMIRLFANITSGHIVILTIISIGFVLNNITVYCFVVVMNALMLVLKILVSFLQAYIFVLLSSIYIGDAVRKQ